MEPTQPPRRRIDWKAIRDTIDIVAVVTNFFGPSQGRDGRLFLWLCPFHDDHNPSFKVDPVRGTWRCWVCGIGGDAAALVMRLLNLTFPKAVAYLTDSPPPPERALARPAVRPEPAQCPKPPRGPSWLPEDQAVAFVEEAERRLWGEKGKSALKYLTGRHRCLSLETIRAARLGMAYDDRFTTDEGESSLVTGVVIPRFSGDGRLALVEIRRIDILRPKPKYVEVYRNSAPLGCYPGPRVIRPGRPLIIVEGAFDALCLGDALGEMAAVVTLGSASAALAGSILLPMLSSPQWFIATDDDTAGNKAAARWPAHARRVRPPVGKDWTEAKAAGVNLRRWWGEILSGIESPTLFTPEELAAMRWGPAVGDPTPGIVIDRPDQTRALESFRASADDPEERAAIQEASRADQLDAFLQQLSTRGIRLDGRLVHPQIAVRAVTGRVTYSEPALQTFTKLDRNRRITPVVEGRVFIRADYGQIEPRILLQILRRQELIFWDAGEDLYRDLIGDVSVDRDTAKRTVNKIINGGRPEPGAVGRLAEFIEAAGQFRDTLVRGADRRGYVVTLAGRRIYLDYGEPNFGGRAVNRVVQGTAADIFNRAALRVDAAIAKSNLPAAVAFLLYDELWVEADPTDERMVPLIHEEMVLAALMDHVWVPVRIDEPGLSDGGLTDSSGEEPSTREAFQAEDEPEASP